jgi:hypothetical protein
MDNGQVAQIADYLYGRVTTDADPIADHILARLQPQLDAIRQRLDRIERVLDTGSHHGQYIGDTVADIWLWLAEDRQANETSPHHPHPCTRGGPT